MENKSWTCHLDIDENGQYNMILPLDMTCEMGWKIGDDMEWIVENNQVFLKKVEKDGTE